jgi:CheY-like chemotaxis protein
VDLMCAFLESEGYRVVSRARAEGAADFIRDQDPTLVLLDIRMEDAEAGRRILDELGPDHPPVVVCTADTFFLQQHEDWLNGHAEGTIAKPFDLDELLDVLQRASGVQPLAC